MKLDEHVSLAALTTFKVGGYAGTVATCESEEDIQAALAYARERGLPWYVLGGGSNVLADDAGYDGLIIRPLLKVVHFEIQESSGECTATAGAGVVWDEFVQESCTRGLWGLENLAGIPGLVGGAPVQNVGAYGADVSDTLIFVDAFNTTTSKVQRFTKEECAFKYRDSRFKRDPSLIILRAVFALSKNGEPHTSYADLAKRVEEARGEGRALLDTPGAIAATVRDIRSAKFPDLRIEGTAGSFFKNPTIPAAKYDELAGRFPGLPGFPVEGSDPPQVKVSLAWILDHVLHLKGYSQGSVRLFEKQPIVVVAQSGATSQHIDALARVVEQQVLDATDITIEREVRSLPSTPLK